MDLVADILLVAGAFGAAVYCYVLARRLKEFQTLEHGMGGAIAVLSAQVDDMTRALEQARSAADGQARALESLTARGEAAAARMELLLAALHDLPEAGPDDGGGGSVQERRLRFVRRRAARPSDGAGGVQ